MVLSVTLRRSVGTKNFPLRLPVGTLRSLCPGPMVTSRRQGPKTFIDRDVEVERKSSI